MTRLFEDISNEPARLLSSLTHIFQAGRDAMREAAQILRKAAHIYVVGIGSSWHAGIAVHSFFSAQGRPVHLADASELLHFSELPADAAVILLSRSGKSLEIVQLLEKCRASKAKIVGVTNTIDSPLGARADVVLELKAEFDHLVSISMYSALAMTGALLACETGGGLHDSLKVLLEQAIEGARLAIHRWKSLIDSSDWLEPGAWTYFLARGASLASAHEARLLWEEASKAPASVVSTGGFRHGPQEVIQLGLRIALWIDGARMRAQDLALANDLRSHGARVLIIGQSLPANAGNLVITLPAIPAPWQFLVDIIPLQIAAERLAHLRGEDCDSFRFCSYIIEAEGGLKTQA